ncbi:MAG: glycosyltransferase family 4 protein [Verrucomicrobia bacterium]|jgi:glycosyltransferase involved in cell wall biosynthesis|nr:glycosyltransferase family 4 protein [Verrucomicrobiota bacterium]
MHLLAVTETNDRSEVELYCALVARGHKVDLICSPLWRGEAPLIRGGVDVIKMPIRHRLDLHASGEIRHMIHRRSHDLIYAVLNRQIAVSLLATRAHKHIPVIGYRGTTGHLSRFDPASWLTYFHPRLKGIVCVSEAVRQYLLSKRIPDDRLHTIHKGHRPEWYDSDQTVDLSEFGIPEGAFVIGFTGNIRPVKGVDVLLRALPLIPSELNVHALLVGEVRDERIAALAANPTIANRVHLAGYRTDAAVLAGACQAFVMPSIEREGLPRAVIEAMSQCVPAIVSNVGGLPELVEDGVTGLVVPPRDPGALATAIAELASDRQQCHAMGLAARSRIGKHFNIDTTIVRIEALFESVAAH